jgi:hypothetical protein
LIVGGNIGVKQIERLKEILVDPDAERYWPK